MDAKNLLDCFNESFDDWLVKSNHSKINEIKELLISFQIDDDSVLHNPTSKIKVFSDWEKIRLESLSEILNILLRKPEADYFWYTYKENNNILTYSMPHDSVVPSSSLRVDKKKIKIFLREIKINGILNED
jgi:hypothetical protein